MNTTLGRSQAHNDTSPRDTKARVIWMKLKKW